MTKALIGITVGLAGIILLALSGFAVWVFIPLLPAGIILVMILTSKRTVIPAEKDTDSRKAA